MMLDLISLGISILALAAAVMVLVSAKPCD